MYKNLILFNLVISLSLAVSAQSPIKFSAQEVKDDLTQLYETLENSSYDIFAFVSKEEMDSAYNALKEGISDSLSLLETYRLFQPFVARVKMSHCNLSQPWGEYGRILNKKATMFPLHLHFLKEKVFVKDNFSTHTQISNSDEIVSINGEVIDELLLDLYENMSGPSNYYKSSILEAYSFPRLYWLFYGECNKFTVRLRNSKGEELEIILDGISGSDLEASLANRSSGDEQEREFYINQNNIAYLRPGKFLNQESSGDLLDHNSFDSYEFCNFIDSAFLEINKNGSQNLIIDLRDNVGGDNAFSDYMIAYFATKPFNICSRFSKRTSQIAKNFWKGVDAEETQRQREQILTLENGSYFDLDIEDTEPNTDPNKRFNGQVYVLINQYSYSNAAYVAAIIQDYHFGEIIGQETSEQVSTYVPMRNFDLTNTKIKAVFPSGFATRPNGDTTPRGVIPDHSVYQNIFTDDDEILQFTIKLIEGK